MKKIFTLSVLLFSMYAEGQVMFQKKYRTPNFVFSMYATMQTLDGGFIIMCNDTFASGSGAYLIKTDTYGDTLWTKSLTIGSVPNNIVAFSMKQTNDGGYIVCGYISSGSDADLYLAKTDNIGNLLWSKRYGGAAGEYGWNVQQTTDGGYIATGYTYSFGAGNKDFYLIKTNSVGDTLWTRVYGGTGSDGASFVKQTSDGGYIVAGSTQSFGAGANDAYLIRTNSNSDTLWTHVYGGINNDNASSVQQTSDGGFIFCGWTNSFGTGSNYDAFVTKCDSNGIVLWSKAFGGSSGELGYNVIQTFDGGYILAGSTSSFGNGLGDAYLVKLNANGDTLWTKAYGSPGQECFFEVQQALDGGYVAGGYTYSVGAPYPFYLVKTDVNGNSGCNEAPTQTIVTNLLTIVGATNTIVNSTSTIVSGTSTLVNDEISTLSTMCSNFPTEINDIIIEGNILFPNPATNQLTIESATFSVRGVEIWDVMGMKCLTSALSQGEGVRVDVSSLAVGIYFVKVRGEKEERVAKFVKAEK